MLYQTFLENAFMMPMIHACHHLNHYVPLLLYNIKITPVTIIAISAQHRQDNSTNHYSHTIAMLFFMLLVIPY